MRTPDHVHRSGGATVRDTVRGAADGLRLFGRDPYFRCLLALVFVPAAGLAGGYALTGPFLLRDLGVPPAAYGAAFALSGVLGLAGSVVAARILAAGRRDPWRLQAVAFACAAAAATLLPAAAGPPVVAWPLAALGLSLPVLFGALANGGLTAVLVNRVGEGMLGRAMAALVTMTTVAQLAGAVLAGVLGETFGVRTALWGLTGGALAVVLAALPWALSTTPEPPEAKDRELVVARE
jgi:predicted MFS family arabinose efflux permease